MGEGRVGEGRELAGGVGGGGSLEFLLTVSVLAAAAKSSTHVRFLCTTP